MAEPASLIDTSNNVAGSLGDVTLKGNKGQREIDKSIEKLRADSQSLPQDQRAIFSPSDEAIRRTNDLLGPVHIQLNESHRMSPEELQQYSGIAEKWVKSQLENITITKDDSKKPEVKSEDFSKYFHLDEKTASQPHLETIRLSAADVNQYKLVTPTPVETPTPPAAGAPTPVEAPTRPAATAPTPVETPMPPATPATTPADSGSHPDGKKPDPKSHEKEQEDKDLDLLRDRLKKAGVLTVKSGHGYDSAVDKIIELSGIKPKDLSKHDYQQLIDAMKTANRLKTNHIIHGHEFEIDKHILESPIVKGLLKKLKNHSTEIYA